MERSTNDRLPFADAAQGFGDGVRHSARPTDHVTVGDTVRRGDVAIHFEPAERLYDAWPMPTCIIADGPYGLSGYPGDPPTPASLQAWYRPHIAAWSRRASAQTTLWFWNSEVGWATVHSVLVEFGWEYRSCHIWDKGLGHVAGNANTSTLRKFPVTTEVCVQYVKPAAFSADGLQLSMQDWLRREWTRTGLPFRLANEACGVKNAATRKYLTADHLWYYPPPEAFERIAAYANEYGEPAGRPYFSRDGKLAISAAEWSMLRAKFKCPIGVTNVWQHPQVGGAERITGVRDRMKWKYSSLHGSQKPLRLVQIAVEASTDEGDVIWEPFGGLCPTAIVAHRLRRRSASAEIIPEFYSAAVERLNREP